MILWSVHESQIFLLQSQTLGRGSSHSWFAPSKSYVLISSRWAEKYLLVCRLSSHRYMCTASCSGHRASLKELKQLLHSSASTAPAWSSTNYCDCRKVWETYFNSFYWILLQLLFLWCNQCIITIKGFLRSDWFFINLAPKKENLSSHLPFIILYLYAPLDSKGSQCFPVPLKRKR